MRILDKKLVKPVIIALGFACFTALAQGPVSSEEMQQRTSTEEDVQERAQTRWDQQAEKTFGFSKGLGQKLMTQEEWREHQRKMQTMTEEEREQYRKEVHQLMKERAKERNISIPDTPGPHGPAGTPGSSGMGMGKGSRGR